MKTLAEKIAVMQAFNEGKPVQFSYRNENAWDTCNHPSWNWTSFDYRVSPKEIWVNDLGDGEFAAFQSKTIAELYSQGAVRVAVPFREVIK